MPLQQNLDELRGRFHRVRRGQPLLALARAMHIALISLRNFARGRDVSLGTLRAIEAWCDQQEETEPTHAH